MRREGKVEVKQYRWFFAAFTLAEVVMTVVYFLVVREWDAVIFWGAFIYVLGMTTSFAAYRLGQREARRKEMVDALLGGG